RRSPTIAIGPSIGEGSRYRSRDGRHDRRAPARRPEPLARGRRRAMSRAGDATSRPGRRVAPLFAFALSLAACATGAGDAGEGGGTGVPPGGSAPTDARQEEGAAPEAAH